jgi:hypothetical protein
VRLHRKYEAERLSQRAPTKAPKHCYLPAPIPEGKKPQDDLKYVYLSQDEDGRECKATWHSRTVEIDYGEFKEKELRRRQQHDPSVEIVTVYRKEVFTLQACGPIDEEDPESEVVPLYGRHRKHLRLEDDEPVPAPFDDLLPYIAASRGAAAPSDEWYHTQVLPEQAPGRVWGYRGGRVEKHVRRDL